MASWDKPRTTPTPEYGSTPMGPQVGKKPRPTLPLFTSGDPTLGTKVSQMFGSADPGDECDQPCCRGDAA